MNPFDQLLSMIESIELSGRKDADPQWPILKSWTEGGTALTNFDPEQGPVYEEAIRRHGDPRFMIVSKPMLSPYHNPRLHSLHMIGKYESASSFWRTFEEVREEFKQRGATP